MEAVLNITAPIFFLVLLGYLGVRFGFIPKAGLPGLGRYVLYFSLPALVFTKLLEMDLVKLINLQFMAVYAAGGLLTSLVVILISRYVFKDAWESSGVRGMGASVPNSVFIGLPILLQIFAHPPTQAFAMAIVVENIIFIPVGIIFIEAMLGRKHKSHEHFLKPVFKRISTNPIIISVVLGVVCSLLGLKLPAFLDSGLNMLAKGTASVALLVIGGSLVGVSLKGSISQMFLVAAGKLLLFPLIIFCLLSVVTGIPVELKMALIVFAAVPMFSIYPIIGGEYGEQDFCSSALMITTVLSFFTLSFLLRFLV